jgi:hypothetical protein
VVKREYDAEGDRFFNYCLWEYHPVLPCANKLRSSNLLFHSFEYAGADERMFGLVEAIRREIGVSMTVWGLKHSQAKIGWEFYFYDYRRRERERSMTRVLQAIEPFIAGCTVRANERNHYFMFSIDIRPDLVAGARPLDEIHMYIGNPGSTVSSGICYSLTGTGARLENFYFFFDATQHAGEIEAKIACSAHVDAASVGLDQILWPELRECTTICLANKQLCDCIYFSGITVDQLIFFLHKLQYPRELRAFVEDNRSCLDHLRYDVGFDYRIADGRLEVEKSGYYGIF